MVVLPSCIARDLRCLSFASAVQQPVEIVCGLFKNLQFCFAKKKMHIKFLAPHSNITGFGRP